MKDCLIRDLFWKYIKAPFMCAGYKPCGPDCTDDQKVPKLYKLKCYDTVEKIDRPIESIDFDCLTIEFNDTGSNPKLRTSGSFTDVCFFIGECDDEQGNVKNWEEIRLDRD